jgi:hypothetical protein
MIRSSKSLTITVFTGTMTEAMQEFAASHEWF